MAIPWIVGAQDAGVGLAAILLSWCVTGWVIGGSASVARDVASVENAVSGKCDRQLPVIRAARAFAGFAQARPQ